MTQQIRRNQEERRKKRSQQQNSPLASAATGEGRREAEEHLKKIDEVLSEYRRASSSPTLPSVPVGQQQVHQVVRPLSDEELVRNFRQTEGE